MQFSWDGLNTTIQTAGTTFASVVNAINKNRGSGSGSVTPVLPAYGTPTPQTSGAGTTSADKWQMVTLGVAGAALLGAVFLLFKQKR